MHEPGFRVAYGQTSGRRCNRKGGKGTNRVYPQDHSFAQPLSVQTPILPSTPLPTKHERRYTTCTLQMHALHGGRKRTASLTHCLCGAGRRWPLRLASSGAVRLPLMSDPVQIPLRLLLLPSSLLHSIVLLTCLLLHARLVL